MNTISRLEKIREELSKLQRQLHDDYMNDNTVNSLWAQERISNIIDIVSYSIEGYREEIGDLYQPIAHAERTVRRLYKVGGEIEDGEKSLRLST